MFSPVVACHPLTRRDALRIGAATVAAGALRPAVPAFAARPAVFELDLSGLSAEASASGGWRTTPVIDAPRRFDLLGLRWARGSHAEAMVRARRRGGRWTDWVALHPAGDHAPDGERAPAGTDPAFTGAADQLQLRLRGRPRRLRARLVRALPRAGAARRLARRSRARARASATAPAIIPRSAWGGDSVPPREPPYYGTVEVAFVHHTVTANDYAPEESAAIVLGIARYHRDSNGWNDIGYNFLVDQYGQVFEGRAGGVEAAVAGAHAQGFNSTSTGVACLGDFTAIPQPEAGMDALARVIAWKLSLHGVPVQGEVVLISGGGPANRHPAGAPVTFQRISGHRDAGITSCPGDTLYTQLADLRARAARYAGPVVGLAARVDSTTVRGARPVTLRGRLGFPDGASPDGAAIDVEYQSGGSAWSRVGGARCAADGSWEAQVEVHASGLVRAVFGGGRGQGRMESSPISLTVLPRLTIGLTKTRLRLGRTVTVDGTAELADTVSLVLERRTRRGRWKRERKRALSVQEGVWEVRLRPRRRTRYRVTAAAGPIYRRRRFRVL